MPGGEAEWDLFRTFEAVARHGSLTAAAKALRISQSTVSRQLARLEESAKSPLILRESPVRLTDRGAALRTAIEPMIDAALAARSALESAPELRGQVTITTVGEVTRWVLAQRLGAFYRAYPHLRLRLLASNQQASLSAGEADIALRMARPERGDLIAKKLGSESYGFFVSADLVLGKDLPWLGLAGSLAQIPEHVHADRAFARPARLLMEDLESLGIAVQSGLGVAVLPRLFAKRLSLVEVNAEAVDALDLGPIPTRELWLVIHRSKHKMPIVRAVVDWLTGLWEAS